MPLPRRWLIAAALLAVLAVGVFVALGQGGPASGRSADPPASPVPSPVPSAVPSDAGATRGSTSGPPTVPSVPRTTTVPVAPLLPLLPGLGSLAARAQRAAQALQNAEDVVHLTVANFNTLGASHTAPHGKDPGKADGSVRGAWAGRLLLAHGVDVAALQEFQQSQAQAFVRAVGSTYEVWPGTSGAAHDGENSVAWRRDRFEKVKTEKRYYPYFFGRPRLFPLVLLRDKATGIEFWMTSYHNPANTAQFGNQARWKARALALEIPDIKSLLSTTRLPLLVAGDMNDRGGFFCPVVASTPLHAANGGSSSGSVCQVPAPRWIDWIMGSPEITFTDYRQDLSAAVRRTSDHPIVLTEAAIARGAGQSR